MRFNFFEPFTQFFWLLMKTTSILCFFFDTVNIYKVSKVSKGTIRVLFYLIELSVCLVFYNSDVVFKVPDVNKRVSCVFD